jgi:hypothetical protein
MLRYTEPIMKAFKNETKVTKSRINEHVVRSNAAPFEVLG